MSRLLRALALLDADGHLSLTSLVWLATLGLAISGAVRRDPWSLAPFAVATISVEHRRHLSKIRVADQLRTLNESVKALNQLVAKAQADADKALGSISVVSLGSMGRKAG